MSKLAARMRLAAAANHAAGWTPAKLTGLAGWWRADSIAQADGTAVSSWPDLGPNGNTLTQATGTKQPTYHTGISAQAIGSQPVVSFASANIQRLSNTAAVGLPKVIPLTCIVISRNAGNTGTYQVAVDYQSGWGAGVSIDGSQYGFFPYSGGGNVYWNQSGTAGTNAIAYQIDGTGNVNINKLAYATANSGSGKTITGTLSTFSIGARATDDLPWNGDIAEVILLNTTLLTNTSDWAKLAAYIWDRYNGACVVGLPYNAASGITITSYDGSNTIIEQQVVDFGSGNTFNGYRYWMAYVPWGATSVAEENPSIAVSNDNATWTTPPGLTNPVVAYPGGGAAGNNSDPGLVYNPDDNKLYLIYNIENATNGNNGIWVRSSVDGVTWSAGTQVYAWTVNHEAGEPNLIRTGANAWTLLAINNLGAPSNSYVMRWTGTSPVGPFTAQASSSAITMNRLGASTYLYHWGSIAKIGSKWVGLANDGYSAGTAITPGYSGMLLWLWSSTDLQHFTFSRHPVLFESGSNFDNAAFYTGSVLDAGDGVNLKIYYTGSTSAASSWKLGITTIPQTEIP